MHHAPVSASQGKAAAPSAVASIRWFQEIHHPQVTECEAHGQLPIYRWAQRVAFSPPQASQRRTRENRERLPANA